MNDIKGGNKGDIKGVLLGNIKGVKSDTDVDGRILYTPGIGDGKKISEKDKGGRGVTSVKKKMNKCGKMKKICIIMVIRPYLTFI